MLSVQSDPVEKNILSELYLGQKLNMSETGKRMGLSKQSVMRRMRLYGLSVRGALWQNGTGVHPNLGKKFSKETCQRISDAKRGKPAPRGEKSHSWKGGRYTTNMGYVVLHRWDHPSANKWGMVKEHIVVAEEKIGRKLIKGEVVHHLNGIRSDNRPDNLEVMDARAHSRLHAAERKMALADLVRGLGRTC